MNPDRVREVVSEVLRDPAYDLPDPPLLQRLLEVLLDAVGALLADSGLAGGLAASVVMVAVLLVLAVLALWFLRSVRGDRPLGEPLAGPSGRRPEEWAAEAAAHEAAGRLREAVRARYRQSLAELVGAGILVEAAGHTTGEVAAAVAEAAPGLVEPWRDLTSVFERAWYGRAPLARDDLNAVTDAQARIRARSRRSVGAAA